MREPAYENGQTRLYLGHVLEVLAEMPSESVHCVVTSPPYWGLRDYGTGDWEGGDPSCDHEMPKKNPPGSPASTLKGGHDSVAAAEPVYRDACGKCGAERIDGQLGMEDTPEEFVDAMLEVFAEVRRVLRKDGTAWVNMGDGYNSRPYGPRHTYDEQFNGRVRGIGYPQRTPAPGLKPKDLIGMPWMLAFGLRSHGWFLRSDIIWAKPNPMPESVEDRPTKSHEYVFLLSKSADYFYDTDAIREAHKPDGRKATAATIGPDSHENYAGAAGHERWPNGGRNKRDVWTIPPKPYPEAHFATFPEALVEPCILAGTSLKGACSECGAPVERVVEKRDHAGVLGESYHDHVDDLGRGQRGVPPGDSAPERVTLRWARTCAHEDAELVPCTVLDPFIGSGTTAAVAQRLGRRAVGIDLNPEYLELAKRRCMQIGMMLA